MENVMNIYEGVENRQVAGRGVGTEMMVSRQAQEVQAAMVIAQKSSPAMRLKVSTGSCRPASAGALQNRLCMNIQEAPQR